MEIEILDEPIRFHLHGKSSTVENERFGDVGFSLMNAMWQVVKEGDIATTGVNHWVYLPLARLFVGVELQDSPSSAVSEQLEPFEFELTRRLKHVHVGPYQALPAKWQALKAELAARGETIAFPSLEIYGHPGDDPAKLETTILIALQAD